MRKFHVTGWVLVSFLLAGAAFAADPVGRAVLTPNAQALSSDELDRRVQWLETTLDDGAGYSKIWQHGWTGGYAMGTVIGTAVASTTHSKTRRVNGIVTAVKGVIGTTRLLWTPHPGRLGAEPMREVVGNDRQAQLARLAAGEAQLQEVADRADKRLRWMRHAGNIALNVIGGAFSLGFGDDKQALLSAGVGIAVGELMIFTSPKRGAADLRSYRQQFASLPQDPTWTVSLVPTAGGGGIKIDF